LAERRPQVTWVFGATLDGRVAAPDGTSRWISSKAARVDAHRLRATHDAVLVGTGAARADDPHLGLRHGVSGRPPIRIVLDARGDVVTDRSRVVDDAGPTVIVLAPDAPEPRLPSHVRLLRVPTGDGRRFDLVALLAALDGLGVERLLVEGGPTVASAFVRAGLVDRIVGYVNASVLGAGRSVLDLPGVTTISDARRFRLLDAVVVGDDVRITAAVRRREATSGA
jgi:diaminohydroxyphosphoribosylaminopyrimidine deaminase/5-amino-6-(5-phosphoribosylamino)uracil reductase